MSEDKTKLHEFVGKQFTRLVDRHMRGVTDETFREQMDLLITAMGGKNNCYFTCIQNATQPCLQACQQSCLAGCGESEMRGPRDILLDNDKTMKVQLLSKFRTDEAGRKDITERDRIALVEEARSLFDGFYAHLDLKRAMLAIDPIGECNVLLREIERREAGQTDHYCDIDFYHDLLAIFTNLRDAHTSFTLPDRYSSLYAHLPFTVEEYYVKDDPEPKTMVTAVAPSVNLGSFKPGVQIYCWNELPVCRKISDIAHLAPGANRMARRRMAASMLTTRWLGQMPMPDEDSVTIKYRTPDGKDLSIYLEWHVYTNPPGSDYMHGGPVEPRTAESKFMLGVNKQALELQRARYRLYKRQKPLDDDKKAAIAAVTDTTTTATDTPIKAMKLVPNVPDNIDAGILKLPEFPEVGYLRIHNFDTGDSVKFTLDIAEILSKLPQDRLIIDMRGNPGDLIPAGELLLRLFTDKDIEAANVRFRSTRETKNLVTDMKEEFGRWTFSLNRASETGSEYSAAFPVTRPSMFEKVPKGIYGGKVALLVDAMTYSTGDFFAAGFKDYDLGVIIGTDHSTGAGGATRWEHDQLLSEFRSTPSPLKPFPADLKDAQMSVAVQCATHAAGSFRDMPFEGLGVEVDRGCTFFLTKEDLTDDGINLLCFAASKLM